jgi:hypothetical protein
MTGDYELRQRYEGLLRCQTNQQLLSLHCSNRTLSLQSFTIYNYLVVGGINCIMWHFIASEALVTFNSILRR